MHPKGKMTLSATFSVLTGDYRDESRCTSVGNQMTGGGEPEYYRFRLVDEKGGFEVKEVAEGVT